MAREPSVPPFDTRLPPPRPSSWPSLVPLSGGVRDPVRKCCPISEFLPLALVSRDDFNFTDDVCVVADRNRSLPSLGCSRNCSIVHRPLTCAEKYTLFDNETWRVTESGLAVRSSRFEYQVSDYCVERVIDESRNEPLGVRPFLCFQSERPDDDDDVWHDNRQGHYIFAACHFASSFFILASLAIFVVLKPKTFEKITIFFLSPLFLGQVNYAVALVCRLPNEICVVEAVDKSGQVSLLPAVMFSALDDLWSNVSVGRDVSEIVKCCPLGHVVVPRTRCVAAGAGRPSACAPPKCSLSYDLITCPPNVRRMALSADDVWQISAAGIVDTSGQPHQTYPVYCVDVFVNYSTRPSGVYPIVCHLVEKFADEGQPADGSLDRTLLFDVYPVLCLLSAAMILLMIVLYVTVIYPLGRGRSTSTQKLINLSYLTTLFAGLLTNAVVHLTADSRSSVLLCAFYGFAVQFFFLATFFWLNVMCIDIYWAFSDLKSLGRAAGTWRDRKKLLCYSAYAWGMPLLILCITLAVDYSPSIPTNSRFKPAMGLDKCFFRGRIAGWTYFYGPMAIILFINCLLFAVTAFHLYRHRRGTAGVLKRGDSQRHGGGNDKERFNLYLKLFIVMGINWLSEVVSFTFNTDVPRYLWYLTDITNTLQGVFIFLIFVWKQRVRQLIWDKLCKGKRGTASANNTSSTSITTNSIRSHHNSIKMNALNNISSVPNNSGSDEDD
ncbi:g-protein coupled receptor [Nesidiocoris tenuis]|uniref:G-protein coupled receptor n=1 Tax=Nesidiocoris tenuis TaxID=355587 RepID=A0ABN7ASQ9_9HEMI|nr:g-protein coupled receptor [Nesidiocoris tenuis]